MGNTHKKQCLVSDAPNYILKMDRSGLKHGNEYHPSTFGEWEEENWKLGIKWSSFKELICSGTHWLRFMILIQGITYNTWM